VKLHILYRKSWLIISQPQIHSQYHLGGAIQKGYNNPKNRKQSPCTNMFFQLIGVSHLYVS